MNHYFAPCPRGLEALLADELVALGACSTDTVPGGVAFNGDQTLCYRANLESRLATRILQRLASAPYHHEDDIFRLALDVNWPALFAVTRSLRVDTTASRSPLRSLDYVSLRVKDALCDRFRQEFGERPNIDTRTPDVRVQVYLTENWCTLYLDTSGAPLWQRGYRKSTVDAPLKENLAAGILKLSGWQPGTPLIDPMCGGGTFLIEAALMALDRAPGLDRHFAFEGLADFDAATWATLRNGAEARVLPPGDVQIWGSDRDEQALKATRRNLDAAGLTLAVQLEQADLEERAAPAASGILVANPPYGERLGELDELAAFYPRLGDALKARWAGWTGYFFTADTRFAKLLGLKPSRRTPLFNGALECRLYEVKVVAGSNRENAR